MKYHVGSPVEGDDFHDREKELSGIWRSIDGNNLLLLAPRRVGKTSLMKRLVNQAKDKGFNALYLTVEGATDEADFAQRLYRTIAEHHPDKMRKLLAKAGDNALGTLLKNVKKVGALGVSIELSQDGRENWRDAILTLGALLAGLEENWLFAIDELPLFVLKLLRADESGERAATFLHNLRELRQNQTGLRWLLAGSIGLDTVTGRYRLTDTINDLKIIDLGPFATDSADAFLVKLSESYDIDLAVEVRSHLLERLRWLLPYYLQLVFSELVEYAEEHSAPPNTQVIDHIFEKLLKPANKNYFDYWRQRLKEELGDPDEAYATTLLNSACLDPDGCSKQVLQGALVQHIQDPDQRDQRLRYLLDILENDGYLVHTDQAYRFRFPLLREYWQRRVAQ